MNILTRVGDRFLHGWGGVRRVAALLVGVVVLMPRRKYWPRTVRVQLARQLLFTGVEALGITSLIALLAGVSVVNQVMMWLSRLGQSDLLGRVLVAVVIREAAPLLVNFIVIGRSATAVATELATMRSRGEVNVLEAHGIDPTVYLVMPRALGMALSSFCLVMVFIAVSLASGLLLALLLGVAASPERFVMDIFRFVRAGEIAGVLAKTLLPGLVVGGIACYEGLTIRGASSEIPQAVTRTVVRSLEAVLVIMTLVSVVAYV
jgi:phospholipid/cholesterol/gamma-HCH transport system permease protein